MKGLLSSLPKPPPDKHGWPWREETTPPSSSPSHGWPRITVVTPSYNQAGFLEETIRSVLLQNYPNLEFIVIDGGSTDGSVELIRKYAQWITFWVSEKDSGQSNALNKGFARATGELVGWQNSDDYFGPGSLFAAGLAMRHNPEAGVIHGPITFVNETSAFLSEAPIEPCSITRLNRILLPIGNQSMFFHRALLPEGDVFREDYHCCMDHDLFLRLWLQGVDFVHTPDLHGFYRLHGQAKSALLTERGREELAQISCAVLEHPRASRKLRLLAARELRSICLQEFHALQLPAFRRRLRRLLDLAGPGNLGPGLIGRLLLSFLGAETLGRLADTYRTRKYGRTA